VEETQYLVEFILKDSELLEELQPVVVITHPYEGGHTYHDSTSFALHMSCGLLARECVPIPAVLELTSYHIRDGVRMVHEFLPHKGADNEQRVILLPNEDQEAKQKMFDAFRTQRDCVAEFSTTVEKFRPAPRYVFTRAPHRGRLNYERYPKGLKGKEWREAGEGGLKKVGGGGGKAVVAGEDYGGFPVNRWH